jgi:hypothetical protein
MLLCGLCFLSATRAQAETASPLGDPKGILKDLNTLAKQGEDDADEDLMSSVRQRVLENPGEACSTLLAALKGAKPNDKACAMYIWALGLTKDPRIAEDIMKVAAATKTELVKVNAYAALGGIGGQAVSDFLLRELDKQQGDHTHVMLLIVLAELKCSEILPKTEKLLASRKDDAGWQQRFVFGKLGDVAVPFLLTKVDDADPVIRQNAIGLLGMWLMAPEAAKAIQGRYTQEKDPHSRQVIVLALERVQLDTDALLRFYREIAATEKDNAVSACIREAISLIESLPKNLASYQAEKEVDAVTFEKEFAKLDASSGSEGDLKTLRQCSSAEDEPKLKMLREHILRRNSDEAFYDYEKVNSIIYSNRVLAREVQSPGAK